VEETAVFGLGATERSLGRGIAEFRRASSDLRNAITSSAPLDEPEPGLRAPALASEAKRPAAPAADPAPSSAPDSRSDPPASDV
jgi:hypothetical protein